MEYTLNVGEVVKIKHGILTRDISVTYAGMPSESAFSLVINWQQGAAAAAHNLFFPQEQRELTLPVGRMVVEGVSPTEIRFRLEGTAS